MFQTLFRLLVLALGVLIIQSSPFVYGEAMLQYFNTSWTEITNKMPELAEAGYDSLWLPPPTKGSGGLSVGYDLWDRFDLGSKDQRGSVSTRYGTEAQLLRLVETAHRFGIRVYFDNIMNHNAFDIPGFNADTPVDIYPGFVPEDFHLRVTTDGFYRKWDNTRDWNSAWQVQHLGLADLIDIAQEPGPTNENFGITEGATFPKIKFVRHPNNPEYYCYKPDGTYVGFGTNNGITVQMLADNSGFYAERVEEMLNRSARWLMDRTKADGLRLDAVKHVRADFFGATGAGKDYNDYGYIGQAQRQFNLTRGFNDSRFNFTPQGANVNLRESVFDTEKPRHNAMMFGEHLGEPPPYNDYFDVGMRLVDNVLRNNLNGILGNPSASLSGLDGDGSYGFASSLAVMHAQSHDSDYYTRRELQHALYFTRAGIGLVYTDGNYQAQTLGQSGGAFPRHANSAFLGQFNDPRIPNLLYAHNQFARGYQVGRFSDNDFVAYERIDKRENGSMSDADGVTMLFMMNDNYASGVGRTFNSAFPHVAGGSDAYLYNYSTYGGGFYQYASNITNGSTIVPPGGYFVFSWKNPDPSELWSLGGGQPITILQNGQPADTLTYLRKDGPDGDPNFNPYNVSGAVAGSYSYPYSVPRITNATDLSFIARADGSAENILLQLDGGVDINSTIPIGPTSGEKRDYPPGLSTDTFLGYEQAQFVDRAGPEKFAAINTDRCTFGSAGAETYTGGGATINGNGTNPTDAAAAGFVYHEPTAGFAGWTGTHPTTQYVDNGSTISIYAKTNSVGAGFRMFVYYTNDGTNPEGAAGVGIGSTRVAEMNYQPPNSSDNGNWWGNASFPRPAGTIKYKIGIYKTGQPSQFPSGAAEVARKKKMLTTFQIPHFNGTTALVYPHNDYGSTQTGLSEGFHFLRARTFLKRDGAGIGNGLRSSIYNTFKQTFYYDAQSPTGEIKFPSENDTIGGSRYGMVVRADPSVTEVWYHIDDTDTSNDDSNTRTQAGNGIGFEPFTDVNNNGSYDSGEPFQDLNGNGVWDGNITTTWVKATEVSPSTNITSNYPREWRFDYANIPSSGNASIKVRLREISSAGYKDFNKSDTEGHYTTLVRNVTAAGPATRLLIAYPANDGDLVDSSYIMKVWFSKSLADGTDTQTLINRFLIKIASSESGSATNGVAQSRTNYQIHYNVTNDYHELAFQLPNLYNDQPNFLHTIDITYTNPGSPLLEAFRKVTFRPVASIKNTIVTPPEVDSDGKPYQIVLPDIPSPTAAQRSVPIRVETDSNASNVVISFGNQPQTVTLNSPATASPNGNSLYWDFTWSGVVPGAYTFTSTVTSPNGGTTASRNARVVFRQLVAANPNKNDVDDDGLGIYNSVPIETSLIPLPTSNSETWTNAQVHLWAISGKTDPINPDSDGDDLSDGLELGWGGAVGDTNITTDTNGDGVPNFQPDLDPPIYNTTDNASRPSGYETFDPWRYNLNNSRTDLIAGTLTDPNKPDTDGDQLNDGFEDHTWDLSVPGTYRLIHNGRLDIGAPNGNGILQVISHPPTIYNSSQVDRAKVLAIFPNAVWLETDPNNADTDSDGIVDGDEDANRNSIVDLSIIDRNQTDGQGNYVVLGTFRDFKQSLTVTGTAAGSQAVTFRYADFCATFIEPTDGKTYTSTALDKTKLAALFHPNGSLRTDQLDVIWLETDPRRNSTSGDTLPDGWKIQYGLDPWDNGVIGNYNLHNAKLISTTDNGPTGSLSGDGITNLQHYINGTDPRISVNAPPPPPGSITIGPGVTTTIGGVVNRHEFTDWALNDLIALDPYDGDGTNNQGSDIYHANDGYDSSRDLTAFYAHDGGATSQGGDGNFYFRVDLQDLQPYAEQGYLDIYVAINFGNPGVGEYNLPDNIDTGTALKWQAVVASYQTNVGNVYLWNQSSATHSTAIGQTLSQFGVTARNQTTADGFKKSYYNSDLDSVEFSISRQALLDAGWDGDPNKLLYQIYTTKDATQNSPVGAGDIGGRSDIRDSIRNDYIASDYYLDQPNLTGANSVLRQWVGMNAENDRGKRAKIALLAHANQAILPGSQIQAKINTDASAGYYRPLDVHEAYGVPLNLHITPTTASAIQWAKVNPALNKPYLDGPGFNTRIRNLIANRVIDPLGTTFSDHPLPYFTTSFNLDNVALSRNFLQHIYGAAPSTRIFYAPERVFDGGTFGKIGALGFTHTVVDQMRHILKWYGRNSALGNDGYRINSINGINTFVINDDAGKFRFQNTDNGLSASLRNLLSRKARAGQQDQVVILASSADDFTIKTNADAYDKNIRWLASRPWTQIVSLDDIATGNFDISTPPDGFNDTWGTVTRTTNLNLANVGPDYLDHANQESYDHWYFGQAGLEESLATKVFNIRAGVPLPQAFGQLGSTGLLSSSWNSVQTVSSMSTLQNLARITTHSALFVTGFHDQTANDLSKYSTGAYIYPDTTYQSLAGFSKNAQSQIRQAAIYSRVDAWRDAASNGSYFNSVIAETADVDLDGEPEYLLYNDRLFALFERIGGRLVGAWVRDISTGEVLQAIGNPMGYSGAETEEEGTANVVTGQVGAYRTSGLKDWFATPGGTNYVNDLYTATAANSGTGWTLTSGDTKISKTIKLLPRQSALQISYIVAPSISQLYIRFGLSPHLEDLLLNGQTNLSNLVVSAQELNLFNNNPTNPVRAFLRIGGGTYAGATYNSSAVDSNPTGGITFNTLNMLNQAQTRQVELQGGGTMNFALGFETGGTISYDSDHDGLPDWWEIANGLDPNDGTGENGANGNPDDDTKTNIQEFILQTDPKKFDSGYPPLTVSNNNLSFPTQLGRTYQVQFRDDLTAGIWQNLGSSVIGTGATLTLSDSNSSLSKRFYRLNIQLSP